MPLPCHWLFLPPHPSRISSPLKQSRKQRLRRPSGTCRATPHTDMHLRSPPTTSPSITPANHLPAQHPPMKPCTSVHILTAHFHHVAAKTKQPHVPAIGIAWLRMRYAIEAVWPRPKARFTKARRRCRNAIKYLRFVIKVK